MTENRCPECARPGRRTELRADDLMLEGEPDVAAPWFVCTSTRCSTLWQTPPDEPDRKAA